MQFPASFHLYLDHAATTPVAPEVAQAMLACLTQTGVYGNAASQLHTFGIAAKALIDTAREQVAALIGAQVKEIIWTSGATEAINLALKGVARMYGQQRRHIITVKTEHKAVLDCCEALEKEGFHLTYLSPLPSGLISLEDLTLALSEDTLLVSIMHMNNETGVIQDIHAIADLLAPKHILFHVDAAQSIGKLPIDVSAHKIDLLSMSAHKIYGPKGVGALYVRQKPRVKLQALIHGGGHEQGMRSGTLATHQIVGMGEALRLAGQRMREDVAWLAQLRARFLNSLEVNYQLNAQGESIYPGLLNLSFENIRAKNFIEQLPELAVTTGSACFASGIEPSYVLRAMGIKSPRLEQSLRISFGRHQTLAEMDFAAQLINARLKR